MLPVGYFHGSRPLFTGVRPIVMISQHTYKTVDVNGTRYTMKSGSLTYELIWYVKSEQTTSSREDLIHHSNELIDDYDYYYLRIL